MDTQSPVPDDMLAVAAHDLKSPIQAVLGFLDLAENSGELNERQQYYFGRAVKGLNQMQEIISSILEISRIEDDGYLQTVAVSCDLKLIIGDSVALLTGLADQRRITIHLDVDSELDKVTGDPSQLSRVMNNLLNNAIKFNRDEGHVWITAINQPDSIRVSVRDSGTGIAPDDQHRVFDRFFRSKQPGRHKVEGSGLGLAITKAIIEKHHGTISVESVPDVGTTFVFNVPRRRQIQEGDDSRSWSRQIIGEGHDSEFNLKHESPIEQSDVVDDNTQEAHGSAESDSSSDMV